MALGVRGLRLWRAAPAGGAGWSEFQRPWGLRERIKGLSARIGPEAGPGRSHGAAGAGGSLRPGCGGHPFPARGHRSRGAGWIPGRGRSLGRL